jgi:hypothetical protein
MAFLRLLWAMASHRPAERRQGSDNDYVQMAAITQLPLAAKRAPVDA